MFVFGKRSEQNLEGVKPDLVKVARFAIAHTTVDFSVIEGVRTKARQRELVDAGASWTMNSRHLTGHAIDVAPYVGGEIRWDWSLYYEIAKALQAGARYHDIPCIWGGVWDRRINAIGDPERAVMAYVARRKALGKKANIDGPHIELARAAYP
jgi:peptidoglycan L-alanyl-D-glutamate endopeptidase CwlK